MTTLATPPRPATSAQEDVPRKIAADPSRADRIFDGFLGGSSATVLLIMAAVVSFLFWKGYPALHEAGFGLFTDKSWNPDAHQFWIMPLLLGSVAIALLSVAIAAPISIATALMINEYAPRKFRPVLTGVIDLLATVPSIVYGFWGLELVSQLQAAPAKWMVTHLNFIPLFRTVSPGQFVLSIFACSLICSVTIIPIITSISREVMAQAPRDVCEAALGLGSTRWGMVTDVIFPFSRNGIMSAVLLGIGRGLGETFIVVLVLSPGNHVTPDLMGPGGLGSIALQITEDFTTGSPIVKSGLILLGLVLFVTTLAINQIARLVAQRPSVVA
jgi:phosphate transport system permease protein